MRKKRKCNGGKEKEKKWEFALPEDPETFKAMSDILYTYLYSISKHNPLRRGGKFVEEYNYIYLDKGPNGESKYNATETYKKLGLSKATYYRKFEQLKKLGLIRLSTYHGRKTLEIPFVYSNRIINVKTCEFLSRSYNKLGFVPEDIIKILAILKVWYFSPDRTFTVRQLKMNLGMSLNTDKKDEYVKYMLIVLRGLDLIEYDTEEIKKGASIWIKYTLTKFDDKYNSKMEAYDFEEKLINFDGKLSDEDIRKIVNAK